MFSGDLRGVCEAFFLIIFHLDTERLHSVFILMRGLRFLLFVCHDVKFLAAVLIGVFHFNFKILKIDLLEKVRFLGSFLVVRE
jgi:hypothetical protein